MKRIHLIFLGIAVGVAALIVGVANLGVSIAEVTGLLNIMGDK